MRYNVMYIALTMTYYFCTRRINSSLRHVNILYNIFTARSMRKKILDRLRGDDSDQTSTHTTGSRSVNKFISCQHRFKGHIILLYFTWRDFVTVAGIVVQFTMHTPEALIKLYFIRSDRIEKLYTTIFNHKVRSVSSSSTGRIINLKLQ